MEEPDYIDMIDSAVSFKIMISGHVEQTKQLHTHEEDYRLRRPDCDVVLAVSIPLTPGAVPLAHSQTLLRLLASR